MEITIGTLFSAINLAKAVAGYAGLIETLGFKIDRLAHSELEAGLRALEQACDADKERESLLREARSRFNKAVSLEDNERLAFAHIGLAICHFFLGERHNCRKALEGILEIQVTGKTKAAVGTVVEDIIGLRSLILISPWLRPTDMMAPSFSQKEWGQVYG